MTEMIIIINKDVGSNDELKNKQNKDSAMMKGVSHIKTNSDFVVNVVQNINVTVAFSLDGQININTLDQTAEPTYKCVTYYIGHRNETRYQK